VLSAVVLLAVTACVKPLPPKEDPTIRGVVTEVTPNNRAQSGVILVVYHDSLGEMYELDAIAAGIDEQTELFDRNGGVIAFSDLNVRDVVDVWVSGPIAESYPPQGHAKAVRVIGTFDEIRPLPIPPGLVQP
jgi:hypothetical protein